MCQPKYDEPCLLSSPLLPPARGMLPPPSHPPPPARLQRKEGAPWKFLGSKQLRNGCQKQSRLYFPSQVRYLCGIYIFDGATPENALTIPMLCSYTPPSHNTQQPRPGARSPPGSHAPSPGTARRELLPRHQLGNPDRHSRTGIFSPERQNLVTYLLLAGIWNKSPAHQEERRSRSADALHQISTSPFPKAQLRLKRINCGFAPNRGVSSAALGSSTPRDALLLWD